MQLRTVPSSNILPPNKNRFWWHLTHRIQAADPSAAAQWPPSRRFTVATVGISAWRPPLPPPPPRSLDSCPQIYRPSSAGLCSPTPPSWCGRGETEEERGGGLGNERRMALRGPSTKKAWPSVVTGVARAMTITSAATVVCPRRQKT